MPHPQIFLIQIIVTVNPDGSFTTKLQNYLDGSVQLDPLKVNPGDQVGWLVQVNLGGRKQMPYSLGFKDSQQSPNDSFFGVSSLDVPAGGTSPYLRVLSLQDKISYSLSIKGVGDVFDPEIQSGPDTGILGFDGTGSTFVVTWDTAANTMSYTKDGGPAAPLPLKAAFGDTVEFVAAVAGGLVTDFTITFANNSNSWPTPFGPTQVSFKAEASPTDIGPEGVSDNHDTGVSFPFSASIKVDNNPITSPTAAITM